MHVYPESPSAPFARRLRQRLLAWFRRAQRDLPWRHSRDPYRIWVSEVMLQQTQVAAVIPYFHRFIEKFPTWQALAGASQAEVLRLWEGLGYYRRARDLHAAARDLVRHHAGNVPNDPVQLGRLAGVGRYMVGAILSQAFHRRLPILEANSLRVLSRLFACTEDPRRGPANRWLWDAAANLLPVKGVGDFNQALMELGALVCTPRQPRCHECPAASLCAAHNAGLQAELPRRASAVEVVHVAEIAVVAWRGRRVLLVQRPPEGRWANLWEFPHGPIEKEETDKPAIVRLMRELTGLHVEPGTKAATLHYGVTRFRYEMACYHAEHAGGRFRFDSYQTSAWLHPYELAAHPLSTPQRRLARIIADSVPDKTRLF